MFKLCRSSVWTMPCISLLQEFCVDNSIYLSFAGVLCGQCHVSLWVAYESWQLRRLRRLGKDPRGLCSSPRRPVRVRVQTEGAGEGEEAHHQVYPAVDQASQSSATTALRDHE